MYMRVKMDINEFLSRYAKIYEEIQYCIGHTEDNIMEMDEFYQRMKELDFGTLYAEMSVLNGYLKDIAQRSIELQDKQLLDFCEGIGIIKEID